LGIGVDVLLDLPGLARGAMSLALLAFALHKAWRLAWHRLRSFNPTQASLQVEEHFGGLQSLLVTGVQFSGKQDIEGSADLREVACRQAEEKIAELPTHETVRFGGLRKPAALAAVLVALLAAFAAINSPFFTAALSRFMTPWAAVSYPTRTQIELADEAIFVKEGEPLVVAATIKGEIPETAVIALRTGDGEPRRRKLPVTDGVCQYQVGAAFRGFEYALTAGDAETEWQKVTVISAPKIKRAKTSVQYPTYTRKAADSSQALTLTLPEGSVVDWELDLDQAVQKATLECEGEAPVSMTVSPDGLSVRASYVVNSSKAYSFGWVEKASCRLPRTKRHGSISSRRPRISTPSWAARSIWPFWLATTTVSPLPPLSIASTTAKSTGLRSPPTPSKPVKSPRRIGITETTPKI
jgi:hypothetical protein